MSKINERVEFRLFFMECCGHLLCWVNPRFPSFCPNCGKHVYPQVKGWASVTDSDATLKYHATTWEKGATGGSVLPKL